MRSILENLLLEIRESITCGAGMKVIELDDRGFSVQLGKSPEAVVTVTLSDPEKPSFAVTYPKLMSEDCHGRDSIEDQTSEDWQAPGISWVVRKVYRYGFVPPEGYGKPHDNAGSVELPMDF